MKRFARVFRRPKARILLLLLVLGAIIATGLFMIFMPGRSHQGPLPAFTPAEQEIAQLLRTDVETLATTIGERNTFRPEALELTAKTLETSLTLLGYTVRSQEYDARGVTVRNLEVEIMGATRPDEIIILGAHYDSIPYCPAANDNGSGVAVLLAIARALSGTQDLSLPVPDPSRFQRTLRLVFFTNEEPPWFQTPLMGSWVYASRSRERKENIVAMISLETMGYYSDVPGSQQFPSPALAALYPTTGNFIAFIGGVRSRSLVRTSVDAFRRTVAFPSEGAALPETLPGIGWSDHWSFSSHGYQAIMVTDTAPFRYPHYHEPTDTPDKLDYNRAARVTVGMFGVIDELVNVGQR